jgi:hypothetical protein
MPDNQYEQMLAERISAGRRLMQALVHPEASDEMGALWRAVVRTEEPLLRFKRYVRDYTGRVMPVEDSVFHLPDDDPRADCPWCARRQLRIAEPIPLPASVLVVGDRRSA